MKMLTPLVLIIAAIALFFGYTDPQYKEIQVLKKEQNEYKMVIQKADQLQKKRDALQAKYRDMPEEDKVRLDKLLPDTVDNVRLILGLQQIADLQGLTLKNISVDTGKGKGSTSDLDTKSYGTIKIDFSVTAPYDIFLRFISDLEKSLRLVDVVEFSLTAPKSDVYEYNVKIQTYWLR